MRTQEEEEEIHCPSAIWMQMTSSSATEEGEGEVGCEEIQRARGRGAGESTIPVCPWWCCCSALVRER